MTLILVLTESIQGETGAWCMGDDKTNALYPWRGTGLAHYFGRLVTNRKYF